MIVFTDWHAVMEKRTEGRAPLNVWFAVYFRVGMQISSVWSRDLFWGLV